MAQYYFQPFLHKRYDEFDNMCTFVILLYLIGALVFMNSNLPDWLPAVLQMYLFVMTICALIMAGRLFYLELLEYFLQWICNHCICCNIFSACRKRAESRTKGKVCSSDSSYTRLYWHQIYLASEDICITIMESCCQTCNYRSLKGSRKGSVMHGAC